MKQRKTRTRLIILSLILLASGNLALWFLSPLLFNTLGGINLVSVSLVGVFALFFVLLYACIFTYAQGKPPRRWYIEAGLTYVLLVVIIALALFYDTVLPPNVPFPWRFLILPIATLAVAFYLLRRIPRIRKKIDEMSKDW